MSATPDRLAVLRTGLDDIERSLIRNGQRTAVVAALIAHAREALALAGPSALDRLAALAEERGASFQVNGRSAAITWHTVGGGAITEHSVRGISGAARALLTVLIGERSA